MEIKENFISFIHQLQDDICNAIETADGKAKFIEDKWQRAATSNSPGGGELFKVPQLKGFGEAGGGITRVIANGNVLEKGGVNTSVVYGDVTDAMRTQLKINGVQWFACGISLVVHPCNPFVPTVHFNYRMFELYDIHGNLIDQWFGGGTDLTPYYLFNDDAKHFHQTYKHVCDHFDSSFYSKFKEDCDNYFVNTHRNNERRGIGGIFYDYQKPTPEKNADFWLHFAKACGYAFLDAYIPIVNKRKDTPFTEQHKHWQEIKRGRYVEFNLVHDRGTIFGLKTNGRTESILMSLPPTVRFEYNYQAQTGSEEERLQNICVHPVDWVEN